LLSNVLKDVLAFYRNFTTAFLSIFSLFYFLWKPLLSNSPFRWSSLLCSAKKLWNLWMFIFQGISRPDFCTHANECGILLEGFHRRSTHWWNL